MSFPRCAIPGCENPFVQWTAQFPLDSDLRNRWQQAIHMGTGQWMPSETITSAAAVVCNMHFSIHQPSTPGSYREPTFFIRDNIQTFVASCRLCFRFDETSNMFHSSQCLAPGQTLRWIVDKYFKVFDSPNNHTQEGYLCEQCTVRVDMVHSFWLEINRGMVEFGNLFQKMTLEKLTTFYDQQQPVQDVIVKEEIQLVEPDLPPMDDDPDDPESSFQMWQDMMVSSQEKSSKKRGRLVGTFSEDVMRAAVHRVLQGGILRQVATEYGLAHQTLYRYVRKQKNSVEPIPMRPNYEVNQVFTNEQENYLAEYVIEAINLLYGLSYRALRKMAYQWATANNLPYPEAWNKERLTGKDWAFAFVKRNTQIAARTTKGCEMSKAASFSPSQIGMFFSTLENCYGKHATFADGTRLFLLGEASTAKKTQPTAHNSIPVKIFIVTNPFGERIPPLVVFTNSHNQSYNSSPSGILCLTSPSGSITQELFPEVLRHFLNHTSTSKESPSLLLCDNYEEWISPPSLDLCRESGLTLVMIPRQYSTMVQTLHGNVFSALRTAYKSTVDSWLKSHPGTETTVDQVIQWVEEVYSTNFNREQVADSFYRIGVFPLNRRACYDTESGKLH